MILLPRALWTSHWYSDDDHETIEIQRTPPKQPPTQVKKPPPRQVQRPPIQPRQQKLKKMNGLVF